MDGTRKPRSVFFDVRQDSEDAAVAPAGTRPTGRSRPTAGRGLRGRAGARIMASNLERRRRQPDRSSTSHRQRCAAASPRRRRVHEFVLEGEVHHGNRVTVPARCVYRDATHAVHLHDCGPRARRSPTSGAHLRCDRVLGESRRVAAHASARHRRGRSLLNVAPAPASFTGDGAPALGMSPAQVAG